MFHQMLIYIMPFLKINLCIYNISTFYLTLNYQMVINQLMHQHLKEDSLNNIHIYTLDKLPI